MVEVREGEERGIRTEGGVWGEMIDVGSSWRDDQTPYWSSK